MEEWCLLLFLDKCGVSSGVIVPVDGVIGRWSWCIIYGGYQSCLRVDSKGGNLLGDIVD